MTKGIIDELREEIALTVAKLQRDYGRVYPWQVAMWLPLDLYRSERCIRQHMAHMAQANQLKRISERGGYRRHGKD